MATLIVLCNSGPLMALGKLNRLELLADLYGEVRIPRAVYRRLFLAPTKPRCWPWHKRCRGHWCCWTMKSRELRPGA